MDDIFFEAKFVEDLGDLGCALSHAMVLSKFLFQSDRQYALVLEDDFQIKEPASFIETINEAILNAKHWIFFCLDTTGQCPLSLPI